MAQGGETSLTSQDTITTENINTFANVNSVNISANTSADSGTVGQDISGDETGGTIGNLETTEGLSVTAQGGKINLDAVGDIETSN